MRGPIARLAVSEARPTAREAFAEMQDLCRSVAAAPSALREYAVRYTACRAALLDCEARPALPGFVTQCVTVQRFHEFITLYSPSTAERQHFIDTAFGPRRVTNHRPYDVFAGR